MSSCRLTNSIVNVQFSSKSSGFISGVISPFIGSITKNSRSSFFISNLTAETCAEPVYAKLFKIENDGSVSDDNPLASELVGPGARYSFDLIKLNLFNKNDNVDYVIKVIGCNGSVYKRPITEYNSNQNINAKTSVITDVINAHGLVKNKLNTVSKVNVQDLLNSMENTQAATAIDALMLSGSNSEKFMQIFGSSPSIIQNAAPEVILNTPKTTINELANSVFRVSAFHIDPSYSVAYSWKVDGEFKTSDATFNYIPTANDSGNHDIDVYVGKKDSEGNFDLSKPYYIKKIVVNVNNNILPTPPVVSINEDTPTPRNTNNILINFNTGISFVNCASFSKLGVTETATPPGIMQFNIDCRTTGIQTESITYATGDGSKILYFWAIDNEGVISNPSTLSLVVDSLPPIVNLVMPSTVLKGGSLITLNYSVIDTSDISSLKLSYAADGVNFGIPTSLVLGFTSTTWTVNVGEVTTAKLKLTVTDAAGNVGTFITNAFSIDSTAPPTAMLTRFSRAITNSVAVKMTIGSCADIDSVLITEINTKPNSAATGWQVCSTAVGMTTATISAEGAHTLYAWAKDFAGNVANSPSSVSVILDTTLPEILITTPSPMRGNLSNGSLSWTLTEANVAAASVFNIEIYDGTNWISLGTKAAVSGANVGQIYSLANFAIPNVDTALAKMRISFEDAAENSAIKITNAFMIDISPPVVTAITFKDAITTTRNRTIAVNLNAFSAQGPARITHLCLKYNNSSTPDSDDSCWSSLTRPDINVAPATSVIISNYYFPLGFSSGVYKVYGWVKDEVGQVSNSMNSDITFFLVKPPLISNIIVSNNNNPSLPLAYEKTSFPIHTDVYINWKITDTTGIQPNSVKLEYTFDEITWTTIEAGLSETNHVGCTVMTDANGCYFWSLGAPSDNELGTPGIIIDDKNFKIRITATNINLISTFGTSNNVNTGNLHLIAGNTNSGIGGSASSAMFPVNSIPTFISTESFVMTSKGELFFIDPRSGLLYVSPDDGIQKLLIKQDDTFGIEDGILSNTRLKLAYKIGIDYQDNIYIYDYDRIRKINTKETPMAIITIVGGGSNNDLITKDALALKLTNATYTSAQKYDFHVLGNGDIWFTCDYSEGAQTAYRRRIRFYNHINAKIYSYNIDGTGNTGGALVDLTAAATQVIHFALGYDPNSFAITKMITSSTSALGSGVSSINVENFTSQAPHPTGLSSGLYDATYTGLDGNIYFIDMSMSGVRKYNPITNSFSFIYGSSSNGNCISGYPALGCNANIGGIFVNKQGRLFVMDGGVIRTIDDAQNVQDVFGQSFSYGENTLATNARFKDISSLGIWYDSSSHQTKVIVNDRYGFKIKEFPIGGKIYSIAGTGTKNANPVIQVDALETSINTDGANSTLNNLNMLINPSNGEVYKGVGPNSNYVLQRAADNTWDNLFTPQLGPYTNMDSDLLIGTPVLPGKVSFGSYSVTLFMGMSSRYMLMMDHDHTSGQHRGGAILLYDRTNKTIEKIAGKYGQPNTSTSFCLDGELPTVCSGYYSLQGVDSGYTQAFYDETLDAWILAVVGTKSVRILKKGIVMSTLVNLDSNIRSLTYLRVDGATPKRKIWYCTTDGIIRERDLLTGIEKALKWTISNMSCYSNYMSYSPERSSLIFPIMQNNLSGVAEFVLP